ncbi:MAG: hypothetical protein JSV61_02875 [Anaerolineales bacterium]|nr:MAG: hypothetical protein JSV61_02875 [Anaerolineales bacterium]
MPKTMINCPNCRQPIQADVQQLFDVGTNPAHKQILLSGAFNLAQCPHCGYQGNLATPIVYHDPDKELLLTFVPPEVSMQRQDQERIIGNMINQITNNLPQEKRKGYLLRPQTVLTLQGLVERVLEADGITREMIQAQQQRLGLIQRLLNTSQDSLAEIAEQEDKMIDAEFFALLNRLGESAQLSGDQEAAQKLADLQKSLLSSTTYGRQVQEQTKEIEAAVNSLRELGNNLTRDKLLELIIQAPNDTRLSALVSLTRPGLDYSFFQLLSERIDRARPDGRARLIALREKLLEMTREIDKQVESRAQQSRKLLEAIMLSDNVEEAVMQNLPGIDEFFMQELNKALETARGQGDLEKIGKYQKITNVLDQLSAEPPELAFIEELLDSPDEQTMRKILEANQDKISPELIDTLTNILAQVESSDEKELAARLKAVHRMVVRYSMELNLKK